MRLVRTLFVRTHKVSYRRLGCDDDIPVRVFFLPLWFLSTVPHSAILLQHFPFLPAARFPPVASPAFQTLVLPANVACPPPFYPFFSRMFQIVGSNPSSGQDRFMRRDCCNNRIVMHLNTTSTGYCLLLFRPGRDACSPKSSGCSFLFPKPPAS